jgi:hypothetical protein
MPGPLKGCRVIELAHIMAGPACGLMLADMGADVVKVEKPRGDDTRQSLPPDINGESAAFMMMNRNKRGIVLDLKHEKGKAALRHLLKGADVVIENYRKGTMEKLGLGYDTLKRDNPGLIYCEISGFGRDGPYAERGGRRGARPPAGQGRRADIRHHRRHPRGHGDRRRLCPQAAHWRGAARRHLALRGGDRAYLLAIGHRVRHRRFAGTHGLRPSAERPLPELPHGRRLDQHRRRQPGQLGALGGADRRAAAEGRRPFRHQRKTTDQWLAILDAGGLPAGPVLSITEMHRDPQALAREMIVETDHPVAGPVKAIGLPVKFHGTPGGSVRPAPRLGQHTREVLVESGFDEAQIRGMLADGAAIDAAEADN